MSENAGNQAQDDLQFIRNLIDESREGHLSKAMGLILAAAGLGYGQQAFLAWLTLSGIAPGLEAVMGLSAVLANLMFAAGAVYMFWRDRDRLKPSGVASRAVAGFFMGAGFATLACAAVFGFLALQQESWLIWGLYIVAVFSLQGAAWIATGYLLARRWCMAIGIGWLLSAVALGLTLDTSHYLAVLTLALLGLMAGPGIYMMRSAGDEN